MTLADGSLSRGQPRNFIADDVGTQGHHCGQGSVEGKEDKHIDVEVDEQHGGSRGSRRGAPAAGGGRQAGDAVQETVKDPHARDVSVLGGSHSAKCPLGHP